MKKILLVFAALLASDLVFAKGVKPAKLAGLWKAESGNSEKYLYVTAAGKNVRCFVAVLDNDVYVYDALDYDPVTVEGTMLKLAKAGIDGDIAPAKEPKGSFVISTADGPIKLLPIKGGRTDGKINPKVTGWQGEIEGGAFFTVFSNPEGAAVHVKPGEAWCAKFNNVQAGGQNWNNLPCVLLNNNVRGGDQKVEYALIRADYFGWIDGDFSKNSQEQPALLGWKLDADWDWGTFADFCDGANCTVTVINYGDSVEVRYDAEKDGKKHHMYYSGIKYGKRGSAEQVYFELVVEGPNVIEFLEPEDDAPAVESEATGEE